MPTDGILTWLGGKAANLLVQKLISGFFSETLLKRLYDIAERWREQPELKFQLLYVDALFPSPPKFGELPPNPDEILDKLERRELPSAEDWESSLFRQWQWVAKTHSDPTPFFKLEDDVARAHLAALARLLNAECETDRELFQRECLRLSREAEIQLNAVAGLSKASHGDIGRLLAGQKELASLLQRIVATEQPGRSGDSHAEIDAAVEAMKKGSHDVAIHQLEMLRTRNWDRLSPRERFRVIANLGHVHNAKEDLETAGRYFIDCRQYQPDDEQARCLEAVGYSMIGNTDEALQLATRICVDFPKSDMAWATVVRNSPIDVPFDELLRSIPTDVQSSMETAFALSWRAGHALQFDAAEEFIRAALKSKPESIDLKERLAAILVEFGRKDVLSQYADPPVLSHPEKLREAEGILKSLVDNPVVTVASTKARIRFYLGSVCLLLKDSGEAERHIQAAFAAEPTNAQYGRHLALFSVERKDYNTAKTLLKSAPDLESHQTLILLLDIAIEEDNKEEQQELKLRIGNILQNAGRGRSDLLWAYARLLCRCFPLKAVDELDALIDDAVSQVERHALRSLCLRRSDKHDLAIEEARRAAECIDDGTPQEVRRRVAGELTALAQFHLALPLWKSLVFPKYIGLHTQDLLRCAYFAGEIEFLLGFCADLRANGIYDRDIFHTEINVLQEFSCFQKALQVMQGYLDTGSEDGLANEVRARRSQLAIINGQPELADFDLRRLPQVDEVEPDLGLAIVQVLSQGPRPFEAVDFAYRLLRRHFSSPLAHKAMVASVLFGKPHELTLPETETVEIGSSVKYRDETDQSLHWHTIEDYEAPDFSRDEYPPSHLLSTRLLGLRVNDHFELRKGGLQTKSGTVVEIMSKFKLQFNRCMADWENRFPEEMFLWKFSIPENAPPEQQLAAMLESVEQRHAWVRKCEEFYKSHPLSVSHFAVMTDRPVDEVIEHLSNNRELPIRCFSGLATEVQNALASYKHSQFILDPSALATLYLTRGYRQLSGHGFKLHVSEGLAQSWRRKHLEKRHSYRERGVLAKRDGNFVFAEETPEQVDDATRELREFVEFIDRETILEDALPISHLEKTEVDRMTSNIGRDAVEAIAIARSRNLTLWTDDACVAVMAASLGAHNRIWTDFAIVQLHVDAALTLDQRSAVTSELLRRGYCYSDLTAEVAKQIIEPCNWYMSDATLDSCIDWLSNPIAERDRVFEIAAVMLVAAAQHTTAEHTFVNFVVRILSRIRERSDGSAIIRELRNRIDLEGGFDVVATYRVRDAINDYLEPGRKFRLG